jgi:hypothetical protein
MSLPPDAPNVISSPDHIAECLWQYGEEDLESQVRAGLSNERQRAIALEAGSISLKGVLLDEALARAAVIVLEGAPRDLVRKRRRFRKQPPMR